MKYGVLRLSPVVDPDDVGVAEVRRGLRLSSEPLHERLVGGVLGVEDFDRNPAIEQVVSALIDIGHSAPGQMGRDLITVGQSGLGIHGSRADCRNGLVPTHGIPSATAR